VVSPVPLTLPVRFGEGDGVVGPALVDSGSQADVLDPRVVHLLNLQVRRLDAPIHADLASDGDGIRLSLFVNVPVKIGESAAAPRAFFVSPLPDGVDAILGTPWLRDTGTGVSADYIFHVPAGKPSSCIYDFTAQTLPLSRTATSSTSAFLAAP